MRSGIVFLHDEIKEKLIKFVGESLHGPSQSSPGKVTVKLRIWHWDLW